MPDTLSMSLLLGTDIPELVELLEGAKREPVQEVMAVMTRAQAAGQQRNDAVLAERQRESGVQARPMERVREWMQSTWSTACTCGDHRRRTGWYGTGTTRRRK